MKSDAPLQDGGAVASKDLFSEMHKRWTGKILALGTTSNEGPTTESQENFDLIISFRNIEGARLLQDMLNELVAEWSREASPKVEGF